MWWQCPFVGCRDFLTTPSILGMVWLPSSSRTGSCVLRFQSLPTTRQNKLFPSLAPNSWKPPPTFPAWESRSSTKLLKIKLPNGCRHPWVHDLQNTRLPDKERTQNYAYIDVHTCIVPNSTTVLFRAREFQPFECCTSTWHNFLQTMWVVRQVKRSKSCPLCLFKIWAVSKKCVLNFGDYPNFISVQPPCSAGPKLCENILRSTSMSLTVNERMVRCMSHTVHEWGKGATDQSGSVTEWSHTVIACVTPWWND